MREYETEIKKTLRDIFEYVGVDTKYAEDAEPQGYIERLLRLVGG